jgi:hypothetical protein
MVGVEMPDEVRYGGGWRDAKGANHFSGENALVNTRPTFSRPHSTLLFKTTTVLYPRSFTVWTRRFERHQSLAL